MCRCGDFSTSRQKAGMNTLDWRRIQREATKKILGGYALCTICAGWGKR